MTLDRQIVYGRRLLRAHGAAARVRTRGSIDGQTITGRWVVGHSGRFFLEPDAAGIQALAALASGPWGACADVQLDLPTGVHSFRALVRRSPDAGGWELIPRPGIEVREARANVRVAGPIAALLDRRDGGAWEPATVENVAVDGVAFECAAELAPPTAAALRFAALAAGRFAALPIEIVRCDPTPSGTRRYGARFVDILPGAAEQLIDVLLRQRGSAHVPLSR